MKQWIRAASAASAVLASVLVGTPASAAPPTVSMAVSTVVVNEGVQAAPFNSVAVTLNKRFGRSVSLILKVEDETAGPSDFFFYNLLVEFAPGVQRVDVPFEVISDRVPELNETFRVSILATERGIRVDPSSTQVTIVDNDLPTQIDVSSSALFGQSSVPVFALTTLNNGSTSSDMMGYTYGVSDADVARVVVRYNAAGVAVGADLVAVGPGSTTITVVAPNGVSGVGSVTVTDVVNGVSFETEARNPLGTTTVSNRSWSDVPLTIRFFETTELGRRNPVAVPVLRNGNGASLFASITATNGANPSSGAGDSFSQPGQWVVTPRLASVSSAETLITIRFTSGSFSVTETRPLRHLVAAVGLPSSTRVGDSFPLDVYSLNDLIINEAITIWSVRVSPDPSSAVSPVASVSSAAGSRGRITAVSAGYAYVHFTYGAYSGAFGFEVLPAAA
jgi:hypothetical protein